MHLLCFVSKTSRGGLERALPRLRLHFLERAGSLQRALCNLGAHGVLIVCSDMENDDAVALGLVANYSTTPVIFVGDLTAATVRLLAVLARSGNPRLCLKDYDATEEVDEFLLSYSPARELASFHAALLPALNRLPEAVRQPFESMLLDLRGSNPVEDLAARSRYTTRETRRIIEGAGFRDVHSVLRCPDLINAWGYAQESNYRRMDVARKSGYESREGLIRAVRKLGVLGVSEFALLPGHEVVAKMCEVALR